MRASLYIVSIIINTACVQEINLTFPMDEPKVVIEGLLTDEIDTLSRRLYRPERTGKYVRLTYSNPANIDRSDIESKQ